MDHGLSVIVSFIMWVYRLRPVSIRWCVLYVLIN